MSEDELESLIFLLVPDVHAALMFCKIVENRKFLNKKRDKPSAHEFLQHWLNVHRNSRYKDDFL